MRSFARRSREEREVVIRETAARRSLHPTPVEKDFWVCWLLQELFDLPEVGEHFLFKGGTSLSKAYGAIPRFSEDIDVSIRPLALEIKEDEDWRGLTKSQRDNRIKKLCKKAKTFVSEALLPPLRRSLREHLSTHEWKLELGETKKDLNSLLFYYPMTIVGADRLGYARPHVLIELSARAEHLPTEVKSISPYVAEEYPELVPDGKIGVNVLAAVRTFWEKVTILHAESSRPDKDPLPPRLARHASDLWHLMHCDIGEKAFKQWTLLKRVCEHKSMFYPQVRVDYDAACSGGLSIAPKGTRLTELKNDFESMREYFFKDPPTFDEVIEQLKRIETRVNALSSQ